MLNLAFCDDDEVFLVQFLEMVKGEFKKNKVNVDCSLFTNGNKLIEAFKLRRPYFDVIFLDIDMPQMNGKQIAKELRTLDKNFKLIFITAYEHEALNMFQYNVLAFLPKDKLKIYLHDCIIRAIKAIEEDRPQMQYFRIYDTYDRIAEIKVPLNDIKYIEVLQRKVYLHSVTDSYQLYHYQFNHLAVKYLKSGFLDIHRTCIVNPKFVMKVGESSVWLDNGAELFMSRRKRKQVMESFIADVYEGIIK